MQYSNVVPGRFVSRPNRFLAQVETADGVQTCHVKNTGRCAELLLPGAPVWLQRFGACLLYPSPSPRDRSLSRMPSSA